MKRYMIQETVNHYHMVEIDDELDIEEVVQESNEWRNGSDAGYIGLENVLKVYNKLYGFEYSVEPNYCGTETVHMEVMGCEDDSPELD